jgi:DUF2933 family protein
MEGFTLTGVLVIGAFILLHFFMHRGHGNHAGHGAPSEARADHKKHNHKKHNHKSGGGCH